MINENMREYLQVSDSKAVCVLIWLLDNRDDSDKIHTTLDEIAKQCDVTKVTVNRVFQRLYKKEFLVKIRNGQYQLLKV